MPNQPAANNRKHADDTKPVVLQYCQHSVGLGHLVRSLAIAAALASRFRVVLCSGGRVPCELRVPAGVEVVALSPVGMDEAGSLASLDPAVSLDEAWEVRRAMLTNLVSVLDPSAVLVELFPFGRRKFAPEILAMLDSALLCGTNVTVVSSVRDLLVTGHVAKREHDDEAADRLHSYFDAVIVHADEQFAHLGDTFSPSAPLKVPVFYSGFVCARPDALEPSRREPPEILVSAGGGMVSARLFAAAMVAHREHLRPLGINMRVVTGPFVPEGLAAVLRAEADRDPTFVVEPFVTDLSRVMAQATVSVSQCGYNTAIDILRAGVPAIVVPHDDGGETEQMLRARRLAALGFVSVISAGQLTGEVLARAVLAGVGSPIPPQMLDLDGAARTAAIIGELVAARFPRSCGAPS